MDSLFDSLQAYMLTMDFFEDRGLYPGLTANKKGGSYPLLTLPNRRSGDRVFRPDSHPSLELNPLAAGDQTPFEKGKTAYALMI